MSRIELKTLTPIHIGSGNFLQNQADFETYHEDDDAFVSVIDPKKILDLVGVEHLDDWVLSIENPTDTIARFVKRYSKNATPGDYASRIITNFAEIKPNDTLKESLLDGRGFYYIPGSSIKGAIRTAVLSSLAKGKPLEGKIKFNDKMPATNIEKEFFGNDPNKDIFRFLQVGDAYFTNDCGIATRMVNLNIRHSKQLVDKSKSQVVEAIGLDNETLFQMKLANSYYDFVKRKEPGAIGNMPQDMKSLSSLFMLINQHTEELVSSEIDEWSELGETYEGADYYLESMENILDEIKGCRAGKSCVLRIGHGSGWRFITGAWSENLSNFDEIVAKARPRNERYEEYVFPKSRRMDEDGDILGFVKLTLLDN